MKKIFLFLIFSVSVFGGEFHFENKADISYYDKTTSQTQYKENKKSLTSFLRYDTKESRTTVETLAQYGSNVSQQWNNKNGGKEGGFSIEGLMYEKKLSENFSVAAGVIPFTNNADFFFDEGFVEENGNPLLINLPLQSIFVSYKKDIGDFDTISKLGFGYYDLFKVPKRDTQLYGNSKSNGVFFIQNWEDDINQIQFDAYFVKIKFLEQDAGTLKMASIMYKTFDPIFDAKWFFTAGYSECAQKSSNIVNVTLDEKGLPRFLPEIMPNLFNFEDTKKSGKIVSLGVSKRFDRLTVSTEAIWISKNWVSLVSSTDTDNPLFYENRGRSLIGKLSYSFTRNLKFSVENCWIKKDWTTKMGTLLNPIKSGENPYLPNDYSFKHITNFKLSYTF